MFTRTRAGAIAGIALTTLLAACSSIGGTPHMASLPQQNNGPGNAMQTLSQKLPTGPALFVSDERSNAVYQYSTDQQHPVLQGKITSGIGQPEGLAVDRNGVLYVANNVGNVAEFKPGETTPFKTLNVGGSQSVAVDSKGTLYVAIGGFESDTLYEFSNGSPTPTQTFHFFGHPSCCVFIYGLAIDSADNLYAQAFDYPHTDGHVFKIAPGSTNPIDLGLPIGPGTGLAIDGSDNLYVGNVGSAISVFAPGGTQPFRVITKGINFEFLFTVDKAGALYVPDGAFITPTGVHNGRIVEYAPGQKTPISTIRAVKGAFGAALRQ